VRETNRSKTNFANVTRLHRKHGHHSDDLVHGHVGLVRETVKACSICKTPGDVMSKPGTLFEVVALV
jgi:hypothetical protein